MPKFRKKPVVIEAHQYTGNILPMGDFFDGSWMSEFTDQRGPYVLIGTLEGNMTCSVGDWIIRGVNGEFYPCKPDIFEKTYEPVSSSAPIMGVDFSDKAAITAYSLVKDGKFYSISKEQFESCLPNASAPVSSPSIETPAEKVRWVKCSDRLPLHMAHWITNRFGSHDNDFPVRMNGRYAMANIYDQRATLEDQPKYMIKFEDNYHFEDKFSQIEWLDTSIQEAPAVEPVKKIVPKEGYFVAQCERCNYRASSHKWEGGGQIADTGDYVESYCPVCGQAGCEEADDNEYFDQTKMLTLRIKQLRLQLNEKEWEIYEAKQKISAPPVVDEKTPVDGFSREQIIAIIVDALDNCDENTTVGKWFNEHYPAAASPKADTGVKEVPEDGKQRIPDDIMDWIANTMVNEQGLSNYGQKKFAGIGAIALYKYLTTKPEANKSLSYWIVKNSNEQSAEISRLKEELAHKSEARRLDREEYAKWIKNIIEDELADRDNESLAYRLAFEFDAHVSAVYEGAEQWENEAKALRSELEDKQVYLESHGRVIRKVMEEADALKDANGQLKESLDDSRAEIELLRKNGASLRTGSQQKAAEKAHAISFGEFIAMYGVSPTGEGGWYIPTAFVKNMLRTTTELYRFFEADEANKNQNNQI